MTREYPKISTSQLFCVLLLSRISAEIIYPNKFSETALETVSVTVISEMIRFLIALPLIIYSFKGGNIHRSVYDKNRFFGWTGAIFSAILLFGAAIRTLLNITRFSVKNLLSGGVMWLIFTLAAAFAVYTAVMGVEALARSGAMFLIAAAIITVVVFVADIPYIHKTSFESFTYFGNTSSLIPDIIEHVMRGGDYLIFAAMLPYTAKNRKSALGKTVILFAVISLLITLIICAMNCLVLREMYGQCEFPFTAAASLSDISLFKRLDGFAAAVWSLCAAFRVGAMLLSAKMALTEVYYAKQDCKKESAQ